MKINVVTSDDLVPEELKSLSNKVDRINNIIKTCFYNEFEGMMNVDCINILMTCICNSLFNILFSIVDDIYTMQELIKTFEGSLPKVFEEYKKRIQEQNNVH